VKSFPLVGPDDTYDVKKYQEMLFKAAEELLIHMGYDWKRLQDLIDPSSSDSLPKPRRRHSRSVIS